MQKFCILTLLLFIPTVTMAATPRSEGQVFTRVSDNTITETSPYSDMVMTIVRALAQQRPTAIPSNTANRVSPRNNVGNLATSEVSYSSYSQSDEIKTKQQYTNLLKNSYSGNRNDCFDRYLKYKQFFGHDATLTGQIVAKENGISNGRYDVACEFLDYGHWCFALGFAYAVRDFDDVTRVNRGYKCYTYQEFCESRNRMFDNSKTDEYLSKIINEIVFYNTNIKNTEKNTVMVTTEKKVGSSWTTNTSWKGYDTDSWVMEQIPVSEMTRLLCR